MSPNGWRNWVIGAQGAMLLALLVFMLGGYSTAQAAINGEIGELRREVGGLRERVAGLEAELRGVRIVLSQVQLSLERIGSR